MPGPFEAPSQGKENKVCRDIIFKGISVKKLIWGLALPMRAMGWGVGDSVASEVFGHLPGMAASSLSSSPRRAPHTPTG